MSYLILLLTLVGGWWYRVRGGAPPKLPRIVNLGVWALLMAAPVWWLMPWWIALGVILVVGLASSRGHGDYMGFGHGAEDPNEFLAPIVDALTRSRDGVFHDMVGMVLSGMTYTLAPALSAAYYADPLWLLWLPLGATKGIAYWLGWAVYDHTNFKGWPHLRPGTEIAEVLTGIFLCGGAGLLYTFI